MINTVIEGLENILSSPWMYAMGSSLQNKHLRYTAPSEFFLTTDIATAMSYFHPTIRQAVGAARLLTVCVIGILNAKAPTVDKDSLKIAAALAVRGGIEVFAPLYFSPSLSAHVTPLWPCLDFLATTLRR